MLIFLYFFYYLSVKNNNFFFLNLFFLTFNFFNFIILQAIKDLYPSLYIILY